MASRSDNDRMATFKKHIKPSKRTLIYNKKLDKFLTPDEETEFIENERIKQEIAKKKALLEADEDEPSADDLP